MIFTHQLWCLASHVLPAGCFDLAILAWWLLLDPHPLWVSVGTGLRWSHETRISWQNQGQPEAGKIESIYQITLPQTPRL